MSAGPANALRDTQVGAPQIAALRRRRRHGTAG